MYIANQLTEASLEEIGREFGGKHHCTVLHSTNKIEAMRRSDEALDRTIRQIVNPENNLLLGWDDRSVSIGCWSFDETELERRFLGRVFPVFPGARFAQRL